MEYKPHIFKLKCSVKEQRRTKSIANETKSKSIFDQFEENVAEETEEHKKIYKHREFSGSMIYIHLLLCL